MFHRKAHPAPFKLEVNVPQFLIQLTRKHAAKRVYWNRRTYYKNHDHGKKVVDESSASKGQVVHNFWCCKQLVSVVVLFDYAAILQRPYYFDHSVKLTSNSSGSNPHGLLGQTARFAKVA